jgi:hypothetical protein
MGRERAGWQRRCRQQFLALQKLLTMRVFVVTKNDRYGVPAPSEEKTMFAINRMSGSSRRQGNFRKWTSSSMKTNASKH